MRVVRDGMSVISSSLAWKFARRSSKNLGEVSNPDGPGAHLTFGTRFSTKARRKVFLVRVRDNKVKVTYVRESPVIRQEVICCGERRIVAMGRVERIRGRVGGV